MGNERTFTAAQTAVGVPTANATNVLFDAGLRVDPVRRGWLRLLSARRREAGTL